LEQQIETNQIFQNQVRDKVEKMIEQRNLCQQLSCSISSTQSLTHLKILLENVEKRNSTDLDDFEVVDSGFSDVELLSMLDGVEIEGLDVNEVTRFVNSLDIFHSGVILRSLSDKIESCYAASKSKLINDEQVLRRQFNVIVANEFVIALNMTSSTLQKKTLKNHLYYFVLLNQVHLCEEIFQRNTLDSRLSSFKTFPGSTETQEILKQIFTEIRNCSHALLVVQSSQKSFESFNFLSNSIWKSVQSLVSAWGIEIFSPTMKYQFHDNVLFFEELIESIQSLNYVNVSFSNCQDVIDFRAKWNFKIYFEFIRTEILEVYEKVLKEDITDDHIRYSFDESKELVSFGRVLHCNQLVESLNAFLDARLWLSQVAEEFASSITLLLRRFSFWIQEGISGSWKTKSPNILSALLVDLSSIASLETSVTTRLENLKNRFPFSIRVLDEICSQFKDLQLFSSSLRSLFVGSLTYVPLLVIQENVSKLANIRVVSSSSGVDGASAYVSDLVNPILSCKETLLQLGLSHEQTCDLLKESVNTIHNAYEKQLADVLQDIRQKEATLTRLHQSKSSSKHSDLSINLSETVLKQIKEDVAMFNGKLSFMTHKYFSPISPEV
jgi:hypothetical protein